MKLLTTRVEADFYIARVGMHAGKPMLSNYTSNNAFSVMSDDPAKDFSLAMHLYHSGKVKFYAIGTCQISIRKRDMVRLLGGHKVSDSTLKKLDAINKLIEIKEQELKKFSELRKHIAMMS